MAKSADAFRTISEVAEWLEVPAHVLRFWESKFSQIKPVKRAGGRRYYRPADMLLLGGIKALLHDEGMTIKGVQKLLREQGVRHVSDLSQSLDEVTEGEVSDIALDVTPEPPEPAKVLNFARSGTEAPATPSESADGDDAPPAPALPAATDMPMPQDALLPYDAPSAAQSGPEPDQAAPEHADLKEPPAPQEEPVDDQPPQRVTAAPEVDPAVEVEREPELTPEPEQELSELVQVGSPDPEPELEVQADTPLQPEPEPEATPGPAPLPQPDLPEDASDEVSADSGVLAALADLPRPISTQTAARLGPLLARLSALGAAKSQDGQLRD